MSSATTSDFAGKKVLVTGGANGLGKAIVKKFHDAGAQVFALDRDVEGLINLQTEFPGVEIRVADLLDWDKSRAVVEELLPLDHLVNNAGVAKVEKLPEVSAKNFDLVFGVNIRAPFNLTQVFASGIIKHEVEGGTIVNISSVGDSTPLTAASTYCCSKAAITMLTKCSAAELAKHNIRVNCVRPTGMATALLGSVEQHNPEVFQELMQTLGRQVMKQALEPADVADLVLFLSSPQSSKITGQPFTIDCGFTVG